MYGHTVKTLDNRCSTGTVCGCQSYQSAIIVTQLLSNGGIAIACYDQVILKAIPKQSSRSRMWGLKALEKVLRMILFGYPLSDVSGNR